MLVTACPPAKAQFQGLKNTTPAAPGCGTPPAVTRNGSVRAAAGTVSTVAVGGGPIHQRCRAVRASAKRSPAASRAVRPPARVTASSSSNAVT